MCGIVGILNMFGTKEEYQFDTPLLLLYFYSYAGKSVPVGVKIKSNEINSTALAGWI